MEPLSIEQYNAPIPRCLVPGENMALIAAFILAIISSLMLNAIWRLERPWQNILALYLIFTAQIVFLSQVLSEMRAIQASAYIAGHLLILGMALGLWLYRGRPSLGHQMGSLAANIKQIRQAMRAHPFLYIYAIILITMMLALFFARLRQPAFFVDSVSTHLPRAFYWLTNGTAQHFYVGNFHIIEYPPNASFLYLWLMALSENFHILHLPVWVAAMLSALGTFGLAQRAGFPAAASVFAGLSFLTIPQTILQSYNGQIELLTTFYGICVLLFLLETIQATRQVSRQSAPFLLYASIAFGLLIGTKQSGPMLLPGMGLALALYALYHLRKKAPLTLVKMGIACLLGFFIFGSYNYILNYFSFGNPITSLSDPSASSSVLLRTNDYEPEVLAQFYNRPANLARYIYQMQSLPLYERIPGIQIFQDFNESLFRTLDRDLDLQLESVPQFTLSTTPHETTGLIFYLAMLSSPAFALAFLWRQSQRKNHTEQLVYLVTVWAWVFVLVLATTWSPYRLRIFVLLGPYLMAAILPYFYWPRRLPLLALPIMFIGIVPSAQFLSGTLRAAPINYLQQRSFQITDSIIQPQDRIGVVGDETVIFPYMGRYPEAEFIPVPPDDAAQLLLGGDLDLILAQRDYCTLEGLSYQTLYHVDYRDIRCIYLPDEHFLSLDAIETIPDANGETLLIRESLLAYPQQPMRVLIPTQALLSLGTEWMIHFQYTGPLEMTDILTLRCNDKALHPDFTDGSISFRLDQTQIRPDPALQSCEILFAEHISFDPANSEHIAMRGVLLSRDES